MNEGQNKSWVSYLAVCPFYHRENGRGIWCVGWEPDQFIRLVFNRDQDCACHIRGHCRSIRHWAECPIARMLAEIEEAKKEGGKQR